MDNDRANTMYSSIVRMAHDTGVKVVAEGVETQEQLDFIKSSKIDVVQGYLLSKPINTTDMTSLLFTEYYTDTDTDTDMSTDTMAQ